MLKLDTIIEQIEKDDMHFNSVEDAHYYLMTESLPKPFTAMDVMQFINAMKAQERIPPIHEIDYPEY